MSVTIVSTLPKPTQTAATAATDSASSSDNLAAGFDFASLLLGQLVPGLVPVVLQTLPAIASTTATTTISAAQANKPETDESPVDAASILASLGLITPEPGRNVSTSTDSSASEDTALPALGKTGKSDPDSLTALQTTGGTTKDLKSEEKIGSSKAEPTPAGTLAAEDKPAKFAVAMALATSGGDVPRKGVQADSAPNNLSALSTNVLGHSNQIPANRDTALPIATPFHDKGWATDFGQKIVWLTSNDKQAAQLTLNPPQMGPIEISLTMDKGNATASFVSANADVREAIESALPRLREMFASAGINLGQTNVGAESFQQQAANSDANRSPSQWMSDNAILAADLAGSLPVRAFATQQGNRMVDIFA